MPISENALKWIMRFYPPLLLQRIWVIKFDQNFRGVEVKITRSFVNKNYNKSIFGGTIFAAADPFYLVLFQRIFISKGYKIIAWSKSSTIQYLKPGLTNLYFKICLTDEEISEAELILNTEGKYIRSHPIDIFDTDGALCASILNEVYVRNLNFKDDARNNE